MNENMIHPHKIRIKDGVATIPLGFTDVEINHLKNAIVDKMRSDPRKRKDINIDATDFGTGRVLLIPAADLIKDEDLEEIAECFSCERPNRWKNGQVVFTGENEEPLFFCRRCTMMVKGEL